MLARQARIFYEKLEEILEDLEGLIEECDECADDLTEYKTDESKAYQELRKMIVLFVVNNYTVKFKD